ncbi:MAG: helicase C-terminal domain-containing protein, partial [Bacilli bacterium]
LGFLVIGGAFSEGINLVDDRLIGAVVIGIGMPRLNFESDQIAHYFKEQDKPGRDYAYLNPGMNKIMQAVGRVIRSENDRGAVLLIDERYMYHQYQELFRIEWNNYVVVLTPQEVKDQLSRFFKE